MWIQIRTMDGKRAAQLDGLSKLTKIEDLRIHIEREFEISCGCQRLFFSGKQLEDGHTLFDYGVSLNSLIQVMQRQNPVEETVTTLDEEKTMANGVVDHDQDDSNSSQENNDNNNNNNNNIEEDVEGIYKINELVDARDKESGAWSEGIIIKITKSLNCKDEPPTYHCIYEGFDETEIHKFTEKEIRPRSRKLLPWNKIEKGSKVLVNYNPDDPSERGDWFDCEVTRKESKRNRREIYGILSFGDDHSEVNQECRIFLTDEILQIESWGAVDPLMNGDKVFKRKGRYDCTRCYDDESKPCKECGCSVCSKKTNPDKLILCDECDLGYHLTCLKPPLEQVPEEEWYCPKCKNDTSQMIKPGDKLTMSKKRMKMASANSTSNRDWGKGMACAGRTKICTIVPFNHFGPIPGVEVGTCWRFQIMASEAGVHRNHVGGISGRSNEGAFSILVSGGYEDDIDNGDEVLYTGSGGRDLSGNKRTAFQSCDQKLERFNRALAMNCAAPLDEKNGGTAVDWRAGKPTRLVRSFKLRKHHPKYAPAEGYRYDGIYKVVKYWPQKGQSGFLVWRYMLRRDDEVPAPWTKEGQKRVKELGIKMQYPDGYLEAEAKKQEEKEKEKEAKKLARKSLDGKEENGKQTQETLLTLGKKRKRDSVTKENKVSNSPQTKISKVSYSVPDDLLSKIKLDKGNKRSWGQIVENLDTYQTFLTRVQEVFLCICCQELVFQPVTTECNHNICKSCLQRAFKAEVFSCPVCRFMLGDKYKIVINENLANVLQKVFPGYTAGR